MTTTPIQVNPITGKVRKNKTFGSFTSPYGYYQDIINRSRQAHIDLLDPETMYFPGDPDEQQKHVDNYNLVSKVFTDIEKGNASQNEIITALKYLESNYASDTKSITEFESEYAPGKTNERGEPLPIPTNFPSYNYMKAHTPELQTLIGVLKSQKDSNMTTFRNIIKPVKIPKMESIEPAVTPEDEQVDTFLDSWEKVFPGKPVEDIITSFTEYTKGTTEVKTGIKGEQTSDIESDLPYYQKEIDSFLNTIQATGKTQDTLGIVKTLFPDVTEQDVNQIFAGSQSFDPDVFTQNPEGYNFNVTINGADTTLTLKQDMGIYEGTTKIATLDIRTGKFIPVEQSLWKKLLGGAINVGEKTGILPTLRVLNYPFTQFGEFTYANILDKDQVELQKAWAKEVETPSDIEVNKLLAANGITKRPDGMYTKPIPPELNEQINDIYSKYISTYETKYKEFYDKYGAPMSKEAETKRYNDLEWWEQLLIELPAQIAVAIIAGNPAYSYLGTLAKSGQLGTRIATKFARAFTSFYELGTGLEAKGFKLAKEIAAGQEGAFRLGGEGVEGAGKLTPDVIDKLKALKYTDEDIALLTVKNADDILKREIKGDVQRGEEFFQETKGNIEPLKGTYVEPSVVAKEGTIAGKMTQGIGENIPPVQPSIEQAITEVPTVAQKTQLEKVPGSPNLTKTQTDKILKQFEGYLLSPSSENLRNMTLELRTQALSKRFANYSDRVKELISQGISYEDALNQAKKELSGILPEATTDFFSEVTESMRDALFSKVYHYFADKPQEIGELISTSEALTNVMLGKSIPRVPGIKGGSAYSRLLRVFSDTPEIINKLDNAATQGKTVRDIVEAEFKDIPTGGIPPGSFDQQMADYLNSLPTISRKGLLGDVPLPEEMIGGKGKLTAEPTGKLGLELQGGQPILGETLPSLTKLGKPIKPAAERMTDAQRLAAEIATPPKDIADIVKYPDISDMLKQNPLIPVEHKFELIRVLKEWGLTPVEIGNFIRANLTAFFDFSWWRQQAALIPRNFPEFLRANPRAFKSLFSQTTADASWDKITRSALYPYYEEVAAKGADFLRPLRLPKGTARWKGVEEFGYQTGESALSRFTQKEIWVKVSNRAFVTGTNEMNWGIFNRIVKNAIKRSEDIAAGRIKLKGEQVYSIVDEIYDHSKMLSNMTGRASLGKASGIAHIFSGTFFAPRLALGRILTPTHLFSKNPRVAREAWLTLSSFAGTGTAVLLTGELMGLWDIEKDPKSTDFMKVRIGDTRIDPWGGYQQYVVLMTRMLLRKTKASTTGVVSDINVRDLFTDFIQGKFSPTAQWIAELTSGMTYSGQKIDWKDPETYLERLLPLPVQDIYQATRDDPTMGGLVTIPSLVGFGVQTYTGSAEDDIKKLGLPKYTDNLKYGQTSPIYDTGDFWADTVSKFKDIDPETLTEQKGFDPRVVDVVEAKQIKEILDSLPSQSLVSINADPDETTVLDYYNMWKDRQKIVASGDKVALKAFDADPRTSKAYLGNITQRELAVITEYSSATLPEKYILLKKYPSLIADPRDEAMRTHPEENARLALYGQSKVYTQEAYDKAMKMAEDLDIPDAALPKELTEYEPENKTELINQKWGVEDFIYKEHDNDKLPDYIENKEFRTDAKEVFLKTHQDYADDRRRRDAYGKDEKVPDAIVEMYVQYYKLPAGNQRTFYRRSHPELDKWGIKVGIWTDPLVFTPRYQIEKEWESFFQ